MATLPLKPDICYKWIGSCVNGWYHRGFYDRLGCIGAFFNDGDLSSPSFSLSLLLLTKVFS